MPQRESCSCFGSCSSPLSSSFLGEVLGTRQMAMDPATGMAGARGGLTVIGPLANLRRAHIPACS